MADDGWGEEAHEAFGGTVRDQVQESSAGAGICDVGGDYVGEEASARSGEEVHAEDQDGCFGLCV